MDMKERVDRCLDGLKDELFKLALDLHDDPELGMAEYKAVQWQKALLEKYGFAVELPYLGLDTAFKASYHGKKAGPNIAYLTEYDALEGVGHACGHNLMALTGCGAGIALREFVDEFGGNVFIFGTPAEETTGGKCIMAERGAFDDMDVAMISHPSIAYGSIGGCSALNGYRLEFFGKPAASGACPELGVNALDAAVNTFNMINALRQHTRDDTRIHGIIEKGGDAANIVPKYASVLMEVRSPDREHHKEICEKVLNCARGAAMGAGARLEISHYEEFFDVMKGNRALGELYDAQVRRFGVDEINPPDYTYGSTDMGNVSQRCPSIHPFFGITGGKFVIGHSHEYAAATKTQLALDNALISAKALALTGAELLAKPEHLLTIKAEFQAS